jgi:hemolysin III
MRRRAARAAQRRVEAAQDAAVRRVEAAQEAAARGVEAAQEAAVRGVEAAQEAAARGVEVARQSAADMREQAAEVVARVKPRLRGVIHEYSFFAALALGALLIWRAHGGREIAAVAIYAAGICGLFGVSALYHRVTWRPRARAWMRRLDHSMIFVFIAASFTPFAMLVLHGALATTILAVAWGGALAGVVLSLLWVGAPKWVTAIVYVALGMVAVVTVPDMWSTLGWLPVAGVALGGALYTAGAVIYATERPDPVPAVFGYHEVFHSLVTGAAALHYAVIAFAVIPLAR